MVFLCRRDWIVADKNQIPIRICNALTLLPPTLRKRNTLLKIVKKIQNSKIKQKLIFALLTGCLLSLPVAKYNIIFLCLLIFLNYVKVVVFHLRLVVLFKIPFLAYNAIFSSCHSVPLQYLGQYFISFVYL